MIRLTPACVVLVALVSSACGDDASETETPTAERVDITVEADGYHPSRVEARAREPVTLVFTRTTESSCAEELVIPSEDVRRELPLNQPVEITLTPSEAGEITFACGMDMLRGSLVVR